jgi:hypothetical protein
MSPIFLENYSEPDGKLYLGKKEQNLNSALDRQKVPTEEPDLSWLLLDSIY